MSSSEDQLIEMERLGVSINSKIMAGFPNESEQIDFNDDRLMMDSGVESPSTLDTVAFEQSVSLYADGTVTNIWKKANIIICSDKAMDEARNLQGQHQNQHIMHSIHVCRAVADLTELSSHETVYKEMWIIVDSQICDLFLRKRSFHTRVEDFFENFAKQSKVMLINRLPGSEESRFQCFRWQLPEECVLEYREVYISSGLLSEEELLMTRDGSHCQQDLAEDDDPSSQAAEDSDAESECDAQELAEGEEKYVQIGSKCQMYIKNLSQTWTVMKQDGTQNTIVLQIVAGPSTSKVVVKVTTDPWDQDLEENIEYEINQETEVINVKLNDASIVGVKRGSVIIEIEVHPGQDIGSVWLQHMVESIFTEKVRACIPSGHRLNFDIESNVTVPLTDLGRYLSENEEEFHKNCVSKEKYEQKVREVEELKRALHPMKTVVTLVSGDITQEKTDAIVNSTNVLLKLNEGGISMCILEAAGPAIQEECRAKYPNGLQEGALATTGGGNLACRNIYHVFLPDTWETDQHNTEQCLRDAVEQILHQADSDGHKTISFPPLGTGNLRYDIQRVTNIITDVCSGFKGRCLQEARLVHPDGFSTNTHSTEEPQRKQEPVYPQPESPLEAKPSASMISAPTKGYERPRTMVNVCAGDITKQEVDVIVCGAPRDLKLNIGGLSKAVLAEAGAEIQQELEESYPSGLSEGRIAFTSGGRKCWKQIYFTTLWPWEETERLRESFIEMILRCLKKVNESQLRTIAFPLLGTSGHSYPPDKVTQWILQAVEIHDATYPSTTLTEVRILVYPNDHLSLLVLQSMNMPDCS
ncbi:uncharacterized protein LOC124252713 isoform X3 [Haliotis rubra]|uniref:uncharacterized protein LOC124252713 isoform X3 n=1 Tax=Haliotis rubra TaxID=36100 RepID=UPI001EE5FE93|nr:uncharacterized protein LOC124252713 isoform X3 [Haliotis rubra]